MDKATFIKTLKQARAEWEALLIQVGEERMLQPGAEGKWSVKDVIAHVTWGEREIPPVMRSHALAGSDLWDMSDDERNEIVYQQKRDIPLHEILHEEQQAYADMLQAVQALSDEDFNDPHRFKDMPEEWMPCPLSMHGWRKNGRTRRVPGGSQCANCRRERSHCFSPTLRGLRIFSSN